MAPLDQGWHQVAELLEALADREALLGPEVDPLEDCGDLEEREAEIPGQRGEVQAAAPGVGRPELVATGIAGHIGRDRGYGTVQAAHPVPPDERGRQIGQR